MRKTSPAPSPGQDARMKPQPETKVPVKVARSAAPDADRSVWAKLAIELANDVNLDQARHVERMANSALMLAPDYMKQIESWKNSIGSKGKGE